MVKRKYEIFDIANLPSSIKLISLCSCCSLGCANFSTSELSTSPGLLQIRSGVKKGIRFSNSFKC